MAAAWRTLSQAARWNGHAAHVTTGAASVSDSHCQASNCSAGIIDSATTGTVRIDRGEQPVAERPGLVRLAARVGSASPTRPPARGGQWRGRVADRRDLGDERVGVGPGRDHHLGPLRRVVHARRDAVELVQPLLDAGGARGARHPADRQVDLFEVDRAGDRSAWSVVAMAASRRGLGRRRESGVVAALGRSR